MAICSDNIVRAKTVDSGVARRNERLQGARLCRTVGPTSKLLARCSRLPGNDAGGASALQGRRTHAPRYEAAH